MSFDILSCLMQIINLSMHYSFKSTPTWTMKGRPQTVTISNQSCTKPGPSDYHAKKPLPHAATIATTRQQRNLYKTFEPNPGPGAYESKSYIKDGTKRSMSARNIQYVKRTPGPQQYDNNTLKVKNKSPGFSMALRSKSYKELEFEKNQFKPAPVSYQSQTIFQNKKGKTFSHDKRKDLTETEKTPAPNYYTSEKADLYASTMSARCAIGNQFRKTTDFMKVQQTPGPAFYDKKACFDDDKDKRKGFSCRNKTANLIALEISKFPGPGQYQSNLYDKNKAARQAPTHTQRKSFMDDMQNFKKEYPGPGVHDPNFSSSKYRSASANHFKKSDRKPLDQNEKTPGPAEYNKQKLSVLNSAPKFSVTKTVAKNEFLGVNPENPGPGIYDPNISLVKSSSQLFGVGKQKRPDFQKQRYTPGPGYYNLRGKQQGPNWKFSTQKRIAFTDKKNEAKQGAHYQIPSKVVDPPNYMRVQSKVKYDNPYKTYNSTMNSINRSPQKSSR